MKQLRIPVFLGVCAVIAAAGSALAADVALTSVGQSPDAVMVKVILKKLKVTPTYDTMLTPGALGTHKVLIAVMGGSSKGLGAAGIDADKEKARAKDLFSAARKKGIKIILMHVGGKSRRGSMSNEFIDTSIPYGDKVIVVEGGNLDGYFDTILKGKNVELFVTKNIRSTSEPLKKILTEWGIL